MATATLKELKEKFKKEPIKNKRVGKQKVKVQDWNLNSRNLMVNLFFNVLKEKGLSIKGKLPSIDAEALSKMKHPLAVKLITFRSNTKTLDSFKNVNSYIHPPNLFLTEGPSCVKAVVIFNVLGYDNIERIFAAANKSIPINIDKRARKAFIVPYWCKIPIKGLSRKTLNILNQIKE